MACENCDPPPTQQEIEEKARLLAPIFGYDFSGNGELRTVVDEVRTAMDTRMGIGVSLVDQEAPHDDEWVISKREKIEWKYSASYEEYLKAERWHENMIQSLNNVSAKLLGHLQDPASEGSWDRRGLVIGHVQSGKTANYMGLVAKAADAGYKFIIVIAGIHNNLRKQTQERIDEGFVGRSRSADKWVPVGVGLDGGYPHPATLTTVNDDFNKRTARQSGWKLNDFSKPIIIVIKKNVRILDSLYDWLKEMNAQGGDQISDVPMLMIDDEADHASINTNKDDIDPTQTNRCIRQILRLFAKSCYIGYTATPFANIFINPETYDKDVHEELFPRDFIYCLDPPNTYFGPEFVFLDDENISKIVKPIADCEECIPFAHTKEFDVSTLPPSLCQAINRFIIARTVRNLRGQRNRHCSMMVNVSRFVSVQKRVRDCMSVYERKLRAAVKANYAMPEIVAEQNSYMQALRQAFLEEYPDCEFGWKEVKAELFRAFENLRMYVINSRSDEVLDYKKYEEGGHALTAIAIGGLSLSRGLTIEGLCISYMYRNTRTYDTLMQMGRWFGYRHGYRDLCRIYLPAESTNWYAHIADASEELRQQINKMRRDRLSPREFGLYVKSHPDSLLITQRSKMRSGEKVTVNQNFCGRLLQSYYLADDEEANRKNEALIAEYWSKGFGGCLVEPTEEKKGWAIRDVPIEVIEEFLRKFQAHAIFMPQKAVIINFLEKISGKYPRGDVVLVSIRGNGEDERLYRLGTQKRYKATTVENGWCLMSPRLAGGRIVTGGDERMGLTKEQKQEAEKSDTFYQATRKRTPDIRYRQIRNKPLLMIHVLDLKNESEVEHGAIPKHQQRVPALGVSFPLGDREDYGVEIEVVANPVWIEKQASFDFDDPDEEDDYDD